MNNTSEMFRPVYEAVTRHVTLPVLLALDDEKKQKVMDAAELFRELAGEQVASTSAFDVKNVDLAWQNADGSIRPLGRTAYAALSPEQQHARSRMLKRLSGMRSRASKRAKTTPAGTDDDSEPHRERKDESQKPDGNPLEQLLAQTEAGPTHELPSAFGELLAPPTAMEEAEPAAATETQTPDPEPKLHKLDCPVCKRKCMSVKGLAAHMAFYHAVDFPPDVEKEASGAEAPPVVEESPTLPASAEIEQLGDRLFETAAEIVTGAALSYDPAWQNPDGSLKLLSWHQARDLSPSQKQARKRAVARAPGQLKPPPPRPHRQPPAERVPTRGAQQPVHKEVMSRFAEAAATGKRPRHGYF